MLLHIVLVYRGRRTVSEFTVEDDKVAQVFRTRVHGARLTYRFTHGEVDPEYGPCAVYQYVSRRKVGRQQARIPRERVARWRMRTAEEDWRSGPAVAAAGCLPDPAHCRSPHGARVLYWTRRLAAARARAAKRGIGVHHPTVPLSEQLAAALVQDAEGERAPSEPGTPLASVREGYPNLTLPSTLNPEPTP